MTSPAAPPRSTLAARIHAHIAAHAELVQFPTEAQLARTAAQLLEDGDKPASTAAYIRLTYTGGARRVSLYLNSAVLTSAGRGERQFVSSLPGVRVRPDDVYLPHGGGQADQAIANAGALREWADGAGSPETPDGES